MKEIIHIIVRVDTEGADIYDHTAICDKIRDILDRRVSTSSLRCNGDILEDKEIKYIDRVDIL